jgi:2-polyprenyl-6-hydroxyphenyl methylase/3-demethylubiquinone-9 3-methyltransferase
MNDSISLHSQEAGRWESNYKKKEFAFRKSVLSELLVADNLAGQHWLDAGCGTGSLATLLSENKGCNVLGVDASAAMIENCRPSARTEFRQIRDICDTGLPDCVFEGAVCSSVLEYVSEPREALLELARVLKRNGLLLVSVPNSDILAWWPAFTLYWLSKPFGRWRLHRYLDYSKHHYTEAGFRQLLNVCGFRVEAVRAYGGVRGFPNLGRGTLMMFRAIKK